MPVRTSQRAGHLPSLGGLEGPLVQVMARATAGDPEAVEQLTATGEGITAVIENRLAPLLVFLAHEQAVEAPEAWLASMRQTAVMRILLENALSNLGTDLDAAGIPWLPLKGMGLPARLYPRPECRPTSDIDVLIPETRFFEARDLLQRQGWEDIHPGPLHEDFLVREGYNWQARHTSGVMLELHFRLWGPVDPELPAAILDAAEPAPGLGSMARLSGPVESYIVAACHLWNSPPPVVLLYFFDLHLLSQAAAGDPGFTESVIALARRHDLQLFVGLAAAVTARLWPGETNRQIAAALLAELRAPERMVLMRARRRSTLEIPLGALVLSRLLSNRKSRSGWRAPFRRLWPHPAIFQGSPAKDPIATLRRAVTKKK